MLTQTWLAMGCILVTRCGFQRSVARLGGVFRPVAILNSTL